MVGAVIISGMHTVIFLPFSIFKSKLSILFTMTAGNAAPKAALHRQSLAGACFCILLWPVSISRSIVSFSLTTEVNLLFRI